MGRRIWIGLGATTLVVCVTSSVVWFSQPRAEVVEVDFSAVEQGEAPEAISHALELAPHNLSEARALWDAQELADARVRLEAALPGGEHEGALHVLLAVVCRRLHDTQGTMEHGLRGAQLLPLNGEAHHVYSRSITEQMRTGGRLAAIRNLGPWRDELRTAITLDPTLVEARAAEFFFFAYVPSLMGGNKQRALELAEEAGQYDETLGLSLQVRALAQLDREGEAQSLIEQGLEAFPRHPSLLLAQGDLYQRAEDWSAADETYARGPEQPQDENGWRLLYERIKLRTTPERLEGDAAAALNMLERYAAGAPRGDMMASPSDVQRQRGQAFELLARMDEARSAYERALELDPKNERAQKALDALDAG